MFRKLLPILGGGTLLLVLAGPALAWEPNVSATADCVGHLPAVRYTASIPDTDWSKDASAKVRVATSAGGEHTLLLGPGPDSESARFTLPAGTEQVDVTFDYAWSNGETDQASVPVDLTDCTPTETKTPKDDKPQGSSTETSRAREPNDDDSIGAPTPPDDTTPPAVETPGTLPFTGPGEVLAKLALGLGLIAAGAFGLRLAPKGVKR